MLKLLNTGLFLLLSVMLTSCAKGVKSSHSINQGVPHFISALQLTGVCDDGDQRMNAAMLHAASTFMSASLGKRLQTKKMMQGDSKTPVLEVCFEQIYLRSAIVTLLLYSVAEPDYMAVQGRLVQSGEELESWRWEAENSAGGSMASPGAGRRLHMLINIINRKISDQLQASDF